MAAFAESGIPTSHISEFYENKGEPAIFYGILRGSGIAMRWCKTQGIDFWYVDNGYFDAQYVDGKMLKTMDGSFRVVKNALIEPYDGEPLVTRDTHEKMKILFLPPTPETAFMHDTTPQDWLYHNSLKAHELGYECFKREKGSKVPLEEDIENVDMVFAFNSMAVIKAIEMGKAVYTSYGVVQNSELFGQKLPYYSLANLMDFYKDKQFTLEEIKKGNKKWAAK
jgi:hypothetical protein